MLKAVSVPAFSPKPTTTTAIAMSTAFEFADHIGVGYVFNNNFDLGLRLQHYSNAGIKKPNSGENFVVLRGAYRF